MQNDATPERAAPELQSSLDSPAYSTSAAAPASRASYRLTVKPPGDGDAIRILRAALKVLLRRYGIRCVHIEQVTSEGRE